MAKIDITKIEGYDKMTPEQKVAALEALEYEDNLSEVERYKNAASKANSEAAEWKKKHNALLSEEDQKKAQTDEQMKAVQAELELLKKEKAISESKAKFVAIGFDESLANDTALAMSNGDNERVFANMKKFNENREKHLKAELLKQTPTPPAGGSGGEITKEQFDKMGYADMVKLQQENPTLYEKLIKGE